MTGRLGRLLSGSPRWPMALGRVVLGVMWLVALRWKLPFDFEPTGDTTGLREWLTLEVEHPGFGFYGDLVDSVVLPNFTLFAWLVFVAELAVGACLLVGVLVRPAALLGLLMSVNLWVGLREVPGEWHWTYVLMAVWHAAVLLSPDSTQWSLRASLPAPLARLDARGDRLLPARAAAGGGRQGSIAAAVLRIGIGVITLDTWLGNVDDDFYDGENLEGFFAYLFTPAETGGNGSSLGFVETILDNTLLVDPELAGWALTFVELFIAAGLLFGVFTRAASLVAVGFFGSLFLSYYGGEDWIVTYVLLALGAAVVFLNWGGRRLGVDRLVAARRGESPATLVW